MGVTAVATGKRPIIGEAPVIAKGGGQHPKATGGVLSIPTRTPNIDTPAMARVIVTEIIVPKLDDLRPRGIGVLPSRRK
jgi:hypothetical protein